MCVSIQRAASIQVRITQGTAPTNPGPRSDGPQFASAAVQVQGSISAAAGNSQTSTPHAAALSVLSGQNSTPRSREEIRRLFTKKSTPQSSANQSSLAPARRDQHVTSRLHHQTGALPESGCVILPCIQAEHQPQAVTHHVPTTVSREATAHFPSDPDFQDPRTFRQFAYPGSSLSAPSTNPTHRSSGHSSHHHQSTGHQQRNSAPAQRNSDASKGSQANTNTHVSGSGPPEAPGVGPFMRAEIQMGPAATIEVNMRFHANIAAAFQK